MVHWLGLSAGLMDPVVTRVVEQKIAEFFIVSSILWPAFKTGTCSIQKAYKMGAALVRQGVLCHNTASLGSSKNGFVACLNGSDLRWGCLGRCAPLIVMCGAPALPATVPLVPSAGSATVPGRRQS